MSNRPTHYAYSVVTPKSANGDEGRARSIGTRVGSVWTHNHGKGLNVKLHSFPVSGEIVIREVKEKDTADSDVSDREAAELDAQAG